jgi:ABC-2 type transport system ATP-binding protein
MSEALVALRGVSKWFGRERVLEALDIDVPRGEVTVLLGRNGCGKSTCMRIVTGLVARDGGTAQVFGREVEDLRPEERERMAYVTDSSAALATATVADELDFTRRVRGARWSQARAQELLERFEVPLAKRLGALSQGQKTRVRLVLALAADPELLLLDEPALGLDLFGRNDLLEVVIETAEREGRAVLLSTHLIDDVERVADRVAFLKKGKIEAQGSIEELRDRYRRARVLLGPGGPGALEKAAAGLVGIHRIQKDAQAPEDERVVLFDGSEDLLARLVALAGAKSLDTRRLTLREIYFEVLSGRQEVLA